MFNEEKLKNMNGYYYYYEGEPVSEEDAITKFQNVEDVIIKPAKESKGN